MFSPRGLPLIILLPRSKATINRDLFSSLFAVSSPEAASALQAAQPEQQFVSLQRAFAALESALRSAGGRGGVFSVLPEGKAVQQDSLSLADDETGPQDKSYLPQAVAKIMGQSSVCLPLN